MKNLLVFVLVFAMVSAANAALTLTIVDNGLLDPLKSGTFGINSTAGTAPADNTYLCAISTNSANFPHGGSVQAGAPADTAIWNDVVSFGPFDPPLPDGYNGIYGFIGIVTVSSLPMSAGLHIDDVIATMGDTIKLYKITDEGGLGPLLDTVTLVPEPMTLALLGLGGLFLRRRK